jgi:dipeptidase D
MPSSIESFAPPAVWKLFAGMSAVPRPSKKEDRIRAHMTEVAKSLGLSVKQDKPGNLLIEVPATKGHERAAPLLLQGHLDMVCEKNSDVQHDFDREGIKLVMDKTKDGKPVVRADGTTLGADNGIGVCLALAAASSPDVVHGPLEILLTFDEEAGMTGAKNVEPGFFKSRRMINLDSEEDDTIYIGCAGGTDVNLLFEASPAPIEGGLKAARLSVSGLRGGHSGGDIHLNRGNAIKVLAQTLVDSGVETIQIVEIVGGSKRNAIPREASALLLGSAGAIELLRASAKKVQAQTIADNAEEKCVIKLEESKLPSAALSTHDSRRIIQALAALPSGVLGVFPDIPGLVQTSNNVSTIEMTAFGGKPTIIVGCLARSASEVQMERINQQIASIGRLAAAHIETANEYPGWNPDIHSPTLKVCQEIYKRVFKHEAKVTAIHAGLECGIIGRRVGGMDMVSFGPTITGAHSPDERVYVESVAKIWEYLKAVLAELAR